MDEHHKETFEEFKDSFSYGSRTDLTFKFLKALSDEEADEFLTALITAAGDLFDDTSTHELIDLIYEWQVRAYTPKEGARRRYVYEDKPFAPLGRPLRDTTLGLLTSSGHYSQDDPPAAVTDPVSDSTNELIDVYLRNAPSLSKIPIGTQEQDLGVVHPGYDTRSASKDPGVNLPIGALRSADSEGLIGALAPVAYSFVGACSQGRLRNELDGWVETWRSAGIEALFLVPV